MIAHRVEHFDLAPPVMRIFGRGDRGVVPYAFSDVAARFDQRLGSDWSLEASGVLRPRRFDGQVQYTTADVRAVRMLLSLIGDGLPMATGAAIACPDRPVLCLEGDGSAMYNVQSLWTQGRENLNVTTLIMNNRSYAILRGELANVGAQNVGPKAIEMLSLDRPDIDWAPLARSMGVEGFRATTIGELNRALEACLASRGPKLIDVVL